MLRTNISSKIFARSKPKIRIADPGLNPVDGNPVPLNNGVLSPVFQTRTGSGAMDAVQPCPGGTRRPEGRA
jgi:hypothetical protein